MQGNMNAMVLANSCIKNKSFKISLNLQVSRHDKPNPLKRNLIFEIRMNLRRSLETLPLSRLLTPKWPPLLCGGSIEPCTFLWSCSS
jgi:hypothetical protein